MRRSEAFHVARFMKRVEDISTHYTWALLPYKIHGSMFSAAGWPDVMVVIQGGKVAFFEFKTEEGELRPKQEYIIKVLKMMKHEVHVVRSSAEAERILCEIIRDASLSILPDPEES